MAPKRTETYAGKGAKLNAAGKFEGDFTLVKGGKAPFLSKRLEVWDRLWNLQEKSLASQKRRPIKIVMPDGASKDGEAWTTSPFDIAKAIHKKLAEDSYVAKVLYTEPVASLSQVVAADDDESEGDGECEKAQGEPKQDWVLWDMTRPLEGNCKLQFFKFDTPEGKDTFWHSSAHILGHALESVFGSHLTIGPPLDTGFYYDSYMGKSGKIAESDYKAIEEAMKAVSKENLPFQRLVLTKAEALEVFQDNPFKVQLITNKVPDGSKTSAYRCGGLIDLCRGPHVNSTGVVKACWVNKNSAAYWLGNAELDSLQRVYAVTFPQDKQLKDYQKFLEEVKKFDHRNLGTQQDLFFFSPTLSPGSCFWTPYGARIYNKLVDMIRGEYRLRGFQEVISPNIFQVKLWEQSGHWQHYQKDMFSMDVEGEKWALKPMNCPGHCQIFLAKTRSYRELPWRMADFGVLHRNEASGALTGLVRVRRFQQDDAHIFCRRDQIKAEVLDALRFLKFVYGVFKFDFNIALSTRPKKALGAIEIWNNAEAQLKEALDEFGDKWELNPGDGAFYGPKIDIRVKDALGRKHQCGTVQLDFQLPIRFNLQYRKEGVDAEEVKDEPPAEEKKDEKEPPKLGPDGKPVFVFKEQKVRNGFERPVMVHRAILGSVERMTAILLEHYKGKLPFWLSPRQVMVIPIVKDFEPFARFVKDMLLKHGFHAEVDDSSNTLNKKVRTAQTGQWNYQAIVGEKEELAWSVNLRSRDSGRPLGDFRLDALMEKLKEENEQNSEKFNELKAWPKSEVGPADLAAAQQAIASVAFEPAGRKPPPLQRQGSSLQLRKAGSKQFAALQVDDDLEAWLEDHPYIGGFAPTGKDAELFEQVNASGKLPTTPNLQRWHVHMESFTAAQRSGW